MAAPEQLHLDVDPMRVVVIAEARGAAARELRIGPIGEPEARALAGVLLNRTDEPSGEGPWRCAVAGGSRIVRLTAP